MAPGVRGRRALSSIIYLLYSAFLTILGGCGETHERRVVLYTSVDQPIAARIVREFEQQTGISVTLVTDTEASKSVGLAERLRAEKSNPQADVWWGNEPFHTINLASEGLFQSYESPAAGDVIALYRDAQHRWVGNGLRARVIAAGKDPASRLADLADPKFKGRIAMARPTAGTTGGHVAALFVHWGDGQAIEFFRKLRENDIALLGGNGPVAEAVGRGQFVLGLTDNDDCAAVLREGGKLSMILPDQDSFGTLMIPTTVALVSGTRHADDAKKLIDYLAGAAVERKLIEMKFAGWSARGESDVRAMQIDYAEVARALPAAVRRATAILEGREE